jgi:hypothetical protein
MARKKASKKTVKREKQWTEVFGLGRNNSFKIPPEFVLKIPGHIFLDLEGLDTWKEDDV